MKKICQKCGREFVGRGMQRYYGSWKIKGTCAHRNRQDVSNKKNRPWKKANRKKIIITDRKYRISHPHIVEKFTENARREKKERRLKIRFRIFLRDNFTCQYCGRKAPEVELQADHKYPKSKGGLNREENYVTACRDCNIGKGDAILNEFIN
jgi:5-methylcytosine-specific restriction endonuclease McrA